MKAELKPLAGKYYGTEIEITDGSLRDLSFKLWKSTGNPSDRELEKYGYTREHWENNEVTDTQLGKFAVKDLDIICDSHYESQEVYHLAKAIVNFINSQHVDIEKGFVDAVFDIVELKKMLEMQTKLVVNLELEKIENERKIEELHEIIKALTKNKLPCNPDHNGECLVCDNWVVDCPLQEK
jgi:hypothetical protein